MGLPHFKTEKRAAAGMACMVLVPQCTQAENLLQEDGFPSMLTDFTYSPEAQGPIVVNTLCATN